MRLAWLSPLPPIPSGIADYSAEILPLIAREAETHVFSRRPRGKERGRALAGVEVHPPEAFGGLAGQYDAIFYHLGNNPHHDYVYAAARKRPGICVFHDSVLHHLISYLFGEKRPDWEEYRAILTEEHGEIGSVIADLRRRRLTSSMEYFLFPLTAHVARRARAIVVHSEDVAEHMTEVAPGVPVTVIPHHAGTEPPDVAGVGRKEARQRLGLPRDAFVVGQLGYMTVPKQPMAVLRGFAELAVQRPDAILLLVGEKQIPGQGLERSIDALGLSDRVRMVGFVDLPAFYLHLKAVDVVVNLRYPSAGEASGTLVRALSQGRAVIVNNVGHFARLPSDVVLKVELDGDQAAQVATHLIRLAQDPVLQGTLEERAGTYAAAEFDQRRCAGLYLEVAHRDAGKPLVSLR